MQINLGLVYIIKQLIFDLFLLQIVIILLLVQFHPFQNVVKGFRLLDSECVFALTLLNRLGNIWIPVGHAQYIRHRTSEVSHFAHYGVHFVELGLRLINNLLQLLLIPSTRVQNLLLFALVTIEEPFGPFENLFGAVSSAVRYYWSGVWLVLLKTGTSRGPHTLIVFTFGARNEFLSKHYILDWRIHLRRPQIISRHIYIAPSFFQKIARTIT